MDYNVVEDPNRKTIDECINEWNDRTDKATYKKIPIDDLLRRMEAWNDKGCDKEIIHNELDKLLLEYIGDERVTAAFKAVPKWHS